MEWKGEEILSFIGGKGTVPVTFFVSLFNPFSPSGGGVTYLRYERGEVGSTGLLGLLGHRV